MWLSTKPKICLDGCSWIFRVVEPNSNWVTLHFQFLSNHRILCLFCNCIKYLFGHRPCFQHRSSWAIVWFHSSKIPSTKFCNINDPISVQVKIFESRSELILIKFISKTLWQLTKLLFIYCTTSIFIEFLESWFDFVFEKSLMLCRSLVESTLKCFSNVILVTLNYDTCGIVLLKLGFQIISIICYYPYDDRSCSVILVELLRHFDIISAKTLEVSNNKSVLVFSLTLLKLLKELPFESVLGKNWLDGFSFLKVSELVLICFLLVKDKDLVFWHMKINFDLKLFG